MCKYTLKYNQGVYYKIVPSVLNSDVLKILLVSDFTVLEMGHVCI